MDGNRLGSGTVFSLLLVDDSDDDVLLFQEAIEVIGIQVNTRVAKNGLEAVETLREMAAGDGLPMLVIMDLNMPVMDGSDAMLQIRADERIKEANVVIFTSSEREVDVERAYAVGANACVLKPRDFGDWVRILRSILYYFAKLENVTKE